MRAELIVEHQLGDPVPTLAQRFGVHRDDVLQASVFAQEAPQAASVITYAAAVPGCVVLAWPTPGRLYLLVEASGGRLRQVSGEVWDIVRLGSPNLRPKLKSLVLLDEAANDVVAEATIGVGANLRRAELWLPLLTSLATAIWLLVALAAFDAAADLVLGAIPAFIAAIIALVILVADVRSKRLVWR